MIIADPGSFLHLVQHRFASHCCETLFIAAAPLVTAELTSPIDLKQPEDENGVPHESMEGFFLQTLEELEGNLGYLMSHPFASHTLRVLLVVLSGKPLADASTRSLLKSKKSEDVGFPTITGQAEHSRLEARTIPNSFKDALQKTMAGMVTGLETTYLRALATHPTGNPVLQLLLELEISTSGKSRVKDPNSLFRTLLPDSPPEAGTESAAYIVGLVYDPIGSRLVETVIQHAPGKTFRALYRAVFREKLTTLAKNDTASYPLTKAIERLSKDELEYVIEELSPKIGSLIERSRTSVIRVLIERCTVREVDTARLVAILKDSYGQDPSEAVLKMLAIEGQHRSDIAPDRQKQIDDLDAGKAHGSLLGQTMLEMPGPLRDMVMEGLISMDAYTLQRVARDRSATRVLQVALKCQDLDDHARFRRTIVQRLTPHVVDLALDMTASHVVDAMYEASRHLRYAREQVAIRLVKGEEQLRLFPSGRAVWRNWDMDLYKKRRKRWIRQDTVEELPTLNPNEKGEIKMETEAWNANKPKTPIELARERYVASLPSPSEFGGKILHSNLVQPKRTAMRAGRSKA